MVTVTLASGRAGDIVGNYCPGTRSCPRGRPIATARSRPQPRHRLLDGGKPDLGIPGGSEPWTSAPCSRTSATTSLERSARSNLLQPPGCTSAQRTSNACDDGPRRPEPGFTRSESGEARVCARAHCAVRRPVTAYRGHETPFPGRIAGRSDRATPTREFRLSSRSRPMSTSARSAALRATAR